MQPKQRIVQSTLSLNLLLLSTWLSAEPAMSQRIVWQKIPVPVVLTVGEERLLHFRAPVSVGVPASLQASLRTQTVNGTVYLMAFHAFGTTRIMVRELDGGQTYLFDVSASIASGESAPIVISVDDFAVDRTPSNASAAMPRYNYVSLTRYAAQHAYAPLRLLASQPGIVRAPIRDDSVALLPGQPIEAKPLAGWRAGSLFVTAVRLTNRSRQAQVLDPRTLRGDWLAATFQHSRLLPAGSDADTTAVYLVSSQPFDASLSSP
ncbi:MAG: TIGR03749 family integrating conjugative element protein [Woeseiaceae bacterium]